MAAVDRFQGQRVLGWCLTEEPEAVGEALRALRAGEALAVRVVPIWGQVS